MAIKKIRLHPRKKKTEGILKGTRLHYNAGDAYQYRTKLDRLIRQMVRETNIQVIKLFKTPHAKEFIGTMDAGIASDARILMNALADKFNKLFGRESLPLAKKVVKQAATTSKSTLNNSLKKLSGGMVIPVGFMTKDLKQVVKASVAENVQLIKSIPQEYFTRVQGSVMRSITTGNGLKTLAPALKKYEGITERRAKNIALDQTRKAYNVINKARMEAVGIKRFEWLHSGGSDKPRPLHLNVLNGQIFSFDDLPIINEKTGEKGIPGQEPHCGCTMTPVIELTPEEDEDAT